MRDCVDSGVCGADYWYGVFIKPDARISGQALGEAAKSVDMEELCLTRWSVCPKQSGDKRKKVMKISVKY